MPAATHLAGSALGNALPGDTCNSGKRDEIPFALVVPDRAHLGEYQAALERGWSPDNLRGMVAVKERLAELRDDPEDFLAALNAESPGNRRVTLPDGSQVPRLPNCTRWIWSGGFAGQISLRWQPGTDALPPICLGHISYGVTPEKRGLGLATRALAAMLKQAERVGLKTVEITCKPDNTASRRVIERNGGIFVEQFRAPSGLGGHLTQRFKIEIQPAGR